MSSNGFANTIPLRLRPSRILAFYLVLIHLIAILALLQPLALPLFLRIFTFALVLASGVYQLRRFRKLAAIEAGQWTWTAQGNWRNSVKSGVYTLTKRGSVNTAWFLVLPLQNNNGKELQRLLICRDQLDANTFRRLRVRLRFLHEDASARGVAPL